MFLIFWKTIKRFYNEYASIIFMAFAFYELCNISSKRKCRSKKFTKSLVTLYHWVCLWINFRFTHFSWLILIYMFSYPFCAKIPFFLPLRTSESQMFCRLLSYHHSCPTVPNVNKRRFLHNFSELKASLAVTYKHSRLLKSLFY